MLLSWQTIGPAELRGRAIGDRTATVSG